MWNIITIYCNQLLKDNKEKKVMEEMRNKLEDVVITFSDDEKSLILIEELTTRFKELMNTEFTEEDFMSDEFDEMKEDYYIDCNQSEVSEITIFDVLLFNQI